MSEHTRKWYRIGREEIRERRKDQMGERDRHICSLEDGSRTPDVKDADANLITAAPDLLEVCEEALAFVPLATCEHANQNEMGRKNAQLCVEQLKAVIAKAKPLTQPGVATDQQDEDWDEEDKDPQPPR